MYMIFITSPLSPLLSSSPSLPLLLFSHLFFSLSVFCRGRFFLCFVLSFCCCFCCVCCCCCVAGAFRGSFSLFPLAFSVTQAVAECLSGPFFCAARRVHVGWPSRFFMRATLSVFRKGLGRRPGFPSSSPSSIHACRRYEHQ